MYHIQYQDINASKKSYHHLKPDELLITKTWETLQGEGIYAGYPAFFIRTSGCDKGHKVESCPWCDTDFRLSEGKIYTIDQLVFQANAAHSHLVVLTGGEPALQPNLSALIAALNKIHKKVQIESNGDRLADGYAKGIATLVVSPKIVPSTQTYKPLREDVSNALDYLKFVVDARPESPYNTLPLWAFERDHSQIYISPLAVYKRAVALGEISSFWTDDLLDREATAANYRYAGFVAKTNNFRLSIQSHLLVDMP